MHASIVTVFVHPIPSCVPHGNIHIALGYLESSSQGAHTGLGVVLGECALLLSPECQWILY